MYANYNGKSGGYVRDLVYSFCVRHNLFIGGTNEQYSKMFDLVGEGISCRELANLIWLCSPNVDREVLYKSLHKEVYEKL